jgi:integrase
MQKYSVRIVFDHRRRTRPGNEGPVEICVTVDRKPYYINTGIKVLEKDWAGSVVHIAEADALNERIGWLVQLTHSEITSLQRQGKAIDVAAIRKKLFTSNYEEPDSLLRWIAREIPLLKIGSGTRRRYDVLLTRMEQWRGITQWSDLTTENLYAFDRWLHDIDKPMSNGDRQAGEVRKIGDAAVYNYHRTLRAMLTRAVKFGMIDSNPYDKVRGEFRKGIKENVEYLTEEEIKAIESLHPMAGTQSAMARDLFVFQLYTGLSYADAEAFDIKDYKLVKGRWRSVGNRIKTGVAYVSDLLPQAVEVLERYNMQVPKINNVQYNLSLKTIQQALGISTRLHSHLARHTFATRALANGVKIQNVSKMLGHTNTRQTERYAKVLAESVHEDFEMLEKKLTPK